MFGGFGKLTRIIGSELVKRGIDVSVIAPKYISSRTEVMELDGMTIYGFAPSVPTKLLRLTYPVFWKFSRNLFKICDADIYHSQNPSPGTFFAQREVPDVKHVITFQDPRSVEDLNKILAYEPTLKRLKDSSYFKYWYFAYIQRAVSSTEHLYTQAKYIIPKVKRIFNINTSVGFLPNPAHIPSPKIRKSDEPTVLFLGRFDPIKRPEIFFRLARTFPKVKFIAVGKAHDMKRDSYLRRKYSHLPNLVMHGFLDGERKSRILEKAWILLNTSAHECLPMSFLEASAHKCAILSCNNPDGFASKFGYYVRDRDFAHGLELLLAKDNWVEKGKQGYEYVSKVHDITKVVRQHFAVYRSVLD